MRMYSFSEGALGDDQNDFYSSLSHSPPGVDYTTANQHWGPPGVHHFLKVAAWIYADPTNDGHPYRMFARVALELLTAGVPLGRVSTPVRVAANLARTEARVAANLARTEGRVAGAFSKNWPVINEQAGGAIAQLTELSCGAACGEMVSGVSQQTLIKLAGAPTHPEALRRALGAGWRGGYVNELDDLLGLERSFVAQMRGESIDHMVVVDGLDNLGRILVRDPWGGGSSYAMLRSEFDKIWTGYVVFR